MLNRIFDGKNEPGLSSIIYNPILNTTDLDGPRQNSTASFLYNNVLSGILPLGEELVLLENNTYVASGTLVIEGNLSVKPNVTIEMDPGASINVLETGELKILGSNGSPVVFQRHVEHEPWGQIVVRKASDESRIFNMSHVLLLGAGQGGDPALETERTAIVTDVEILDSVGGALKASGLSFDATRFVFESSVPTTNSYNVELSKNVEATFEDGTLSSTAAYEFYTNGDRIVVKMTNIDVKPKGVSGFGFYLADVAEVEIDMLRYNTSLASRTSYHEIYISGSNYYVSRFRLMNSQVETGDTVYDVVYIEKGGVEFLNSSIVADNARRLV